MAVGSTWLAEGKIVAEPERALPQNKWAVTSYTFNDIGQPGANVQLNNKSGDGHFTLQGIALMLLQRAHSGKAFAHMSCVLYDAAGSAPLMSWVMEDVFVANYQVPPASAVEMEGHQFCNVSLSYKRREILMAKTAPR